jgi:hypothetical protein
VIAALLGWTKLPQWALELLALAAVAGGVWLWHYETYQSGVKAEVAKVEAQQAKTTAIMTAKATAAEHSHDQELNDLRDYRAAHPELSVRLCVPTARLQATPAVAVSVSTAAAPGVVQPVPAGDTGVRAGQGPGIFGLLDALAARADQVTAQARELQSRDTP